VARASRGVNLGVAGGDLGVEGDVVVQFALVTVVEGDVLLREGFVGLRLFSGGLRRRQRLGRGDPLGLGMRLLVIEELLVDSGGRLIFVNRDRLVIGQVFVLVSRSLHVLMNGLFLDFLRRNRLMALGLL
jgi:hypothetical protein